MLVMKVVLVLIDEACRMRIGGIQQRMWEIGFKAM